MEVDQPQCDNDIDYSKQQKLKAELSKETKKNKIDEFYKKLKNSVTNNIEPLESIILTDPQTTKECWEVLRKLTKQTDYHESCTNQMNYEKGKILSIVKGKCKKDYISLATKKIGKAYCRSYCEHLIRFTRYVRSFRV